MAPTRRPKKPNVSSRQKPKHNRAATDLLVNPGNPPHRHQTCAKADSTGAYHRMVILAQSPPGCRSARSLQKKATVVLGSVEIHLEWMTAVARQIIASKLPSILSLHIAMRLNSFSLPKKFSIRWRHL